MKGIQLTQENTEQSATSRLTDIQNSLASILACKHHTNESMRVFVTSAPTTLVYDYTQWGYVTPSVAKWYEFHSIGNNLAVNSNINNVTGA